MVKVLVQIDCFANFLNIFCKYLGPFIANKSIKQNKLGVNNCILNPGEPKQFLKNWHARSLLNVIYMHKFNSENNFRFKLVNKYQT